KTLQRIRGFDARFDGVLGVAAVDLSDGHTFSHNGDTVFTTASSIKVPILIELFQAGRRRQLRFSDRVTLTPKDATGGDGSLQIPLRKGEDVTLTGEDLARSMILGRYNTAPNNLIPPVAIDPLNPT